jgi:predicted ATP-dependent serine protease
VNHLKKIVKSNSDDIKSFRTDLLIALSNNNELNIKEALFDNFNPNTEQELQAIAKDIPAFGDDVNEEKFDVDGKYNLPEVVQKRDNMEVASVKDIKTMRFKALTLPSKYRQLLGKVPANFRMLLWGSPGHGKSSLALTIANDIGKFVKTLYVSAEESLQSATLSSRIKRFKANARNLMFNDSNNPDILDKIIMTQNPKFVVIDSVNVMIGKTEAIINLMLKYPEVGFIIIAQATKDRKKYAGLGSLAHAVDIVVNVRSGMAVAEKNRYAQLGSMPVKGIKI